jgi:hypothetical protein
MPGRPKFEPSAKGAQDARAYYQNYGRGGRMKIGETNTLAIADIEMDGKVINLIAEPGKAQRPGMLRMPDGKPIFQTTEVGFDRSLDSEVKIYETVARMLDANPNATVTVNMHVEYDMCPSCSGVHQQFLSRYGDRAKVNITTGGIAPWNQ